MPTPSIHQLIAGTVFTLATTMAQAAVVQVDFSYLANNAPATIGLTGMFTYDDANIGTDAMVNANDLLSFSFTLANSSYSVTTDLALLQAQSGYSFVFNYNPVLESFDYGVGKQLWYNASANAPGTSLGIQSAGRGGGAAIFMRLSPIVNGAIQVVVNTENVNAASHKFEYTVTAVPEPETYGMLVLGLGLIGAVARRKKNLI